MVRYAVRICQGQGSNIVRCVPADDKTAQVGQYMMDNIRGLRLNEGSYAGFAFIADNGSFAGGAIVTNFRTGEYGNDCELLCAVETSMVFRQHVLRAVFTYIFDQAKCVRVTSICTKRNRRSRALLERLGFELEGNVRLGYDGKRDALIYGLLAKDCRYWAGGLNGEEVRAEGTAAA